MKSKLVLLLLCVSVVVAKAQELKASWSEQQLYDNSNDGFFDEFLGFNSKFIFAKFTKYQPAFGGGKSSKIKLVALDKITMKKAYAAALIGFPENKASASKYQGLTYYKTIFFENSVYVFWIKETKAKDELYVQSFDGNLKAQKQLQKIYELNSVKGQKKKAELFVMANKDLDEKILIGGEMAGDKGENVKIEYRLLNRDFGFEASNQVTLPYVIAERSNSLSASYELGNDGNLHLKTFITKSKDELKTLRNGESSRYPVLSVVNLKTGVLSALNFKFDNKTLFDFNYIIGKENTKVFGFFSDLIKDANGYDTHGIFYAIVDNKNNTIKSINFSMFTKDQLNKLFSKDKDDQKKARKKDAKKGNDAAKSDEESLQSNHTIESVQSIDKDNLVLFCSIMYNYTVTRCVSNGNGGTTCYQDPYCRKDNVTAFKINDKGDIVWATNVDRQITYSGWSKYDVSVINDKSNFFVLYGSSFNEVEITAKGKSKKKAKSNKEDFNEVEYAVFDYNTGGYQKRKYLINSATTPKEEKKSIDAYGTQVFDNRFYFEFKKTSMKIIPQILCCLGCIPMMYIGEMYHGKGYLGNMSPIK